MKQLVFGFPIAGILSQKGAYPVDSRAKLDILSPGQLFDSAFERIRQRATSALPSHASELWNEACEQT